MDCQISLHKGVTKVLGGGYSNYLHLTNKHIFMCIETLHCTSKYAESLSCTLKYNLYCIGSFYLSFIKTADTECLPWARHHPKSFTKFEGVF